MLKPSPNPDQMSLLHGDLMEQLNPDDPLFALSRRVPWEDFESAFEQHYSSRGKPGKPIRLMVGLLMLKQMEKLSDEALIRAWVRNPYFQAFCGEVEFQWAPPCDSSELTYFRKRIGPAGLELVTERLDSLLITER